MRNGQLVILEIEQVICTDGELHIHFTISSSPSSSSVTSLQGCSLGFDTCLEMCFLNLSVLKNIGWFWFWAEDQMSQSSLGLEAQGLNLQETL